MSGAVSPLQSEHRAAVGVSVVICCHNSERLLPRTLECLKSQITDPSLRWEVLIVDNASTDGTADVARRSWGEQAPVALRIVHEPRLGLAYARERALHEARYEIIGFIDDDNRVPDNWVAAVAEAFAREPRIGALGSLIYPVFESIPPAWWHDYGADYFALLSRPKPDPLFLSGAGMAIRTSAWRALVESGFKSQLIGRKGRTLSGGEDTELTMALRLNGWMLAISPELRVAHFMPNQRLQWNYLRRLVRGYTACHVLLDGYSDYSLSQGFPRRLVSDIWWYQLAQTVRQLVRRPRVVIAALFSSGEGRAEVIDVDKLLGRTIGLLRCRGRYGASRRTLRTARWNRRGRFAGCAGQHATIALEGASDGGLQASMKTKSG